jgi:ABC-type amino acid transport substrate-binding protein
MVRFTYGVDWVEHSIPTITPLLKNFPTADATMSALRARQIQAAILKTPVAQFYSDKMPCDVMAVGEVFATSFFGERRVSIGMYTERVPA